MMRVYPDLERACRAAAELFAETVTHPPLTRGAGGIVVALAGGHTPRSVYAHLAAAPQRDRVPWERMHVFWSDERCVPPDDPRSNVGLARRVLLDHVPIRPDQIHAPASWEDPDLAARRYEAELREFFGDGPPRFDLILLGLGEDGHTASLLPDSPALLERERWVVGVKDAAHPPPRITMTLPVINQAARVVVLAGGEDKADALARALEGTGSREPVPAGRVGPIRGELLWLVDEAAARRRSD